MGTFFLIAGTVLFFAGLGCLLFVFVSIARRLKNNITTSVYFRSKSSSKPLILSTIGVVLIIAAQGFYWFYSEVGRFIPFTAADATVNVSFLYEEFKQPRLVLEAKGENNQRTSEIVPFSADTIAIGVEVVHWKKVCQVLGLKDCYRVNGVYNQTGNRDTSHVLNRLPDQELNGGQSGFVSLVNMVGKAFPGELQILLSKSVVTDGSHSYSVQIAQDSVSATPSVDKQASLNYSH